MERFNDRERQMAHPHRAQAEPVGQQAEAEQRELLEEQQRQKQRMESLDVMAGAVAHHYNNLISAILGFQELALNSLPPGDPVRDKIEKAQEAANRAAAISRSMLVFTGNAHLPQANVQLNEWLPQWAKDFSHKLPPSVHFEVIPSPDLPAVKGNVEQLAQMVENLLENARESLEGKDKGHIKMMVNVMECDPHYLREIFPYYEENLKGGPFVLIQISDDGEGMNRETLSKVFEPFFTTKFLGRGLGLATVMGIVRGHSGAVHLYSEPGFGTCAKVLLPALERRTLARPVEGLPWQGEGTALLIDDDEISRNSARRMLKQSGFEVVCAETGQEGLEQVQKKGGELRFVLLDVMLPDMKGEAVLQEIMQRQPDMKVILCSGYDLDSIARRFEEIPYARILHKPFRLRDLSRCLENLFGDEG